MYRIFISYLYIYNLRLMRPSLNACSLVDAGILIIHEHLLLIEARCILKVMPIYVAYKSEQLRVY